MCIPSVQPFFGVVTAVKAKIKKLKLEILRDPIVGGVASARLECCAELVLVSAKVNHQLTHERIDKRQKRN